jgi:membrane-bound inhibitor of C-type lysozyme
MRPTHPHRPPNFRVLPLTLGMLLAGCSSINLWPFGDTKTPERPRGPVNATEYRCEGGKSFYVRQLDGGAATWVILPDRQIRLDKQASSAGMRYSNGIATLQIDGDTATLNDGPAVSFANCKLPPPAVETK